MFHACVQRFDGMYEKILGGELNRAFVRMKTSVTSYGNILFYSI